MRRIACLLVFCFALACGGPSGDAPEAAEGRSGVTHGPMLGRPGAHQMGVWARTAKPGSFEVRYGTASDALTESSGPVRTTLDHDNAAYAILEGLAADTEYFYEVVAEGGEPGDPERGGSFRTWKDPADYSHPELNPDGHFNFSFEFACGNNQNPNSGNGPSLPTFRTMLGEGVPDQIDFAVLNGDWLYEEDREYMPAEWLGQVGAEESQMPRLLQLAPAVAGVWENYKTYLSRGVPLSAWHREVPSYYTADDHEILNDVYGTATAGRKNRRAVFRDPALAAWYDYLAWSNPELHTQDAYFGRTTYEAGSDVLTDPNADFTALDMKQAANLHVHWGGDTAGVNDTALDREPGDPNAGVYDIVEVLDANRLRVNPPFSADGEQTYSIGRRAYSKLSISNSDVFFLDTRSHRDMHDVSNPQGEGLYMLGKQQEDWLVEEMKNSDAEVFFLFSSVNFMIPHMGATAGGEVIEVGNKDEAWTVFLENRERLIRFWDGLGKPVFILTGDLHNSFAIKITDSVWEFASGPHNSRNHKADAEGNRPANGRFDSLGREAEIRWSTYIREDAPAELNRQPNYAVVQVNAVFNNRLEEGTDRWIKYPQPQVIFQYRSGFDGSLLYSETILGEE